MSQNPNYPITITPLWLTKKGTYYVKMNEEHFDKLQLIGKEGILRVRILADEQRKNETSPFAYLEFVTPEQLAAQGAPSSGGGFKRTFSKKAKEDSEAL